MGKDSQYLFLLRRLLAFQRKRRILAQLSGVSAGEAREAISYADESVLLVLDEQPGQTVKDLAEYLLVERSWMSRIVTSLEERRLVKSSTPEHDKRSKSLEVTKWGREALSSSGQASTAIMNQALEGTCAREQSLLEEFFRQLGNGLGSKSMKRRSDTHPVYLELWRVSRDAGISADQYFGSGYSLTQVQALTVLAEFEGPAPLATDLDRRLPFDISTISRVLKGFEEEGLVNRDTAEHDRRAQPITLTAKGKQELAKVDEIAVARFRQALASVESSLISAGLEVLTKITEQIPLLPTRIVSEGFQVRRVDLKKDKDVCRKFLDSLGVQQPEMSARTPHEVYGLYQESALKGVAFVKKGKSEAHSQVVLVGQGLNEKNCLQLLRATSGA